MQVSKRGTVATRTDAKQQPPQQQQLQTKQQPEEPPRRQQEGEEVPEVVNDRMLKRIVAFSGIPVFVGFSLFPFFYFLKVQCSVLDDTAQVHLIHLLLTCDWCLSCCQASHGLVTHTMHAVK